MENGKKIQDMKKKIMTHLLLPLLAPAAVVGLYFTPKSVFGCANRGLMALGVVLLAVAGAVTTTWKGASLKRRGENEEANWWLLTTLVLLMPLVLLIGPLG
ncbi:MAG: hypothetical protein VB050_12700 [Geobacteraceae bacterium]|nr:hypothetical protein [Geobacteraceae bacterium]